MHTMLKFRCPDCKAVLETKEEHAGSNCGCPNCEATITVPVRQALVPMVRPVIVPEVIPFDSNGVMDLSDGTVCRQDDDKPMELRLGNYFGVKADVDKKTRSLLTSVSLGGILVALGAIIFAMFGGKSKS